MVRFQERKHRDESKEHKTNSNKRQEESSHHVQGFFAVLLLFVTFVFFVLIPDFIYFYYSYHNVRMPDSMDIISNILYGLAYTSDFIVYVIASEPIRKIIIQKVNLITIHLKEKSIIFFSLDPWQRLRFFSCCLFKHRVLTYDFPFV